MNLDYYRNQCCESCLPDSSKHALYAKGATLVAVNSDSVARVLPDLIRVLVFQDPVSTATGE